MAWLWWRQHRADRAEELAIRLYRERREAHRQLGECILDASRRADAMDRLNTSLGGST
jgi:hypothetical protein